MTHAMQFSLAKHGSGRIILHVASMARTHRYKFYLKGILRELKQLI